MMTQYLKSIYSHQLCGYHTTSLYFLHFLQSIAPSLVFFDNLTPSSQDIPQLLILPITMFGYATYLP